MKESRITYEAIRPIACCTKTRLSSDEPDTQLMPNPRAAVQAGWLNLNAAFKNDIA